MWEVCCVVLVPLSRGPSLLLPSYSPITHLLSTQVLAFVRTLFATSPCPCPRSPAHFTRAGLSLPLPLPLSPSYPSKAAPLSPRPPVTQARYHTTTLVTLLSRVILPPDADPPSILFSLPIYAPHCCANTSKQPQRHPLARQSGRQRGTTQYSLQNMAASSSSSSPSYRRDPPPPAASSSPPQDGLTPTSPTSNHHRLGHSYSKSHSGLNSFGPSLSHSNHLNHHHHHHPMDRSSSSGGVSLSSTSAHHPMNASTGSNSNGGLGPSIPGTGPGAGAPSSSSSSSAANANTTTNNPRFRSSVDAARSLYAAGGLAAGGSSNTLQPGSAANSPNLGGGGAAGAQRSSKRPSSELLTGNSLAGFGGSAESE